MIRDDIYRTTSTSQMKILLLAWGLLIGGPLAEAGTARPVATERAGVSSTVYVCMSKGSVAYHSSDGCPGLNRCSHTVKAMSEAEAQELGKRSCLKCY